MHHRFLQKATIPLAYLVVVFLLLILSVPKSAAQADQWECLSNLKTIEDSPELNSLQQKLELDYQWHQNHLAYNSIEMLASDRVIPVVFHIIHDNGAENIADNLILQALDWLNQSMANEGYYDQGTGVNTDIQFCLAKSDPSGNLTSGINRIVSPLTEFEKETQDLELKDLVRWAPTNYLNVWVVKEVYSRSTGAGVAGYAYFPSSHGRDEDGIVIEARFLGDTEASNAILTHEVGHYLGLYHTFEGGCQNDDCQLDGDRVCDTPPDQSTAYAPCDQGMNTCDTDVNSGWATDQNDMISNYMDYSDIDCYSEFTSGQRDRMLFFLDGVRSSLLSSRGCLDPCDNPIIANFTIPNPVNLCDSFFIANTTTNATRYFWYLDDSLFSNDFQPEIIADSIGNQTLKLIAVNDDSTCIDIRSINLQIVCPHNAEILNQIPLCVPIDTTINFQASVSSGNYTWKINGTTVSNNESFVQKYPVGTYVVSLIVGDDKCKDSTSVILRVGCIEVCGNNIDDDGDGLYDCFDPDCCGECDDFYFDPCDTQYDDCSDTTSIALGGTVKWRTTDNEFLQVSSPVCGDIDGDGNTEILLYHNGPITEIWLLDGMGNTKQKITPDPRDRLNFVNSPVIADVDYDGKAEIFYTGIERNIFCLEDDGSTKFMTIPYQFSERAIQFGGAMSIADLNLDGTAEIIFALNIFDATTGEFHTRGTDDMIFRPDIPGRYAIVDILPDDYCTDCKGLEIVNASQILTISEDNKNINIEIELAGQGKGNSAVADWDEDGDLDVIAYKTSPSEIIIWDGQTQDILARTPFQDGNIPTVANFDEDEDLELVITSQFNTHQVTMFDHDLTEIWNKDFAEISDVSLVAFDFDYDGKNEVVMRGQTPLIIYDGQNGDIIYETTCGSLTNDERPLIADIDNDGHAEIVTVCENEGYLFRGTVTAIEGSPDEWTNTRSVVNQHIFFNVNIHDDLTVPSYAQGHHLPDAKLNTFMTMYPIPSEDKYAEYELEVDSSWCSGDSLKLNIKWCSLSNVDSDSLSMTIYSGPIENASTYVITTFKIAAPQGRGACYFDTISLANLNLDPNLDELCFILNDEGKRNTPIVLGQDTLSPISECDYQNNLQCLPLIRTKIQLDELQDTVICTEDSIRIEFTDQWSKYIWSNGDSLSYTYVSASGWYWVNVIGDCGNQARDSFYVDKIETPTLQLPDSIVLCEGGVYTLSVDGKFVSYKWQDDSQDSTFTIFESGKYWVTALDACGNLYGDTVLAFLNVNPSVLLPDSAIICEEDTLTFNIPSYKNELWTPSQFVGCFNCPERQLFPTTSGWFSLYLIDSLGCEQSDSIFITVRPEPITFDTARICGSDSVEFRGIFYSEGNYRVESDSSNCDTIIELSVIMDTLVSDQKELKVCAGDSIQFNNNYYTPGSYNINIPSTNLACDTNLSLIIQRHPAIEVDYDLREKICDSVGWWNLIIQGEGLQNAFINSPELSEEGFAYNDLPSSTYQIEIVDTNNCITLDTIITLEPSSNVDVLSLPDTIYINPGEQASASIIGIIDSAQFNWINGENISCIDCSDLAAFPSFSQEYEVQVIDKNGCIYYLTVYVVIKRNTNIFVPNVFSPNGDQINDYFIFFDSDFIESITTFEIYDRWGELVYRENNTLPSNFSGWDGKFRGSNVNPGVFTYNILIVTKENNNLKLNGSITVIR